MSRPAGAEDPTARRKVVVLKFAGPQAGRVHSAIVAGLRRQADVVDEDEFGEVLASAQGPTRQDRIAAACRDMGVDAAVEGGMRRAGRTWSVEVFVRDCANGEKILPSGRATYSMRNLGGVAAIRGSIWTRLREAISAATGTSGGGGRSSARVASTSTRRSTPAASPSRSTGHGTTTAIARASTSSPAPSSPRADADRPCIFNEDEPPEGFPGYGDWVRRRNAYLNRCEEQKRQRAADLVRQRQEAQRRARAEAEAAARREAEEAAARQAAIERQRREDELRRRREAENRRRAAEEEARRAEAERQAERRRREEADRRRREEEQERLAETRRREHRERMEAERAAETRRRHTYEENEDDYEDPPPPPRRERRHGNDDDEIEREVAAYRARLERERLASLDRPDYDDRRSSRADEQRTSYDDPGEASDGTYHEPRYSERSSEEPGGDYDPPSEEDGDPVYDPDRDDPTSEDLTSHHGSSHEEETVAATAHAQPGSAPTVFNIGAGIGFANRQMTVQVTGSDKPRSYSAPGYPEMMVEARFFPGALVHDAGTVAGLGAFGLYRHHLFLQTSGLDEAAGTTIDIPTSEQELAGGLVFRTPLGNTPRSPIFEIALGYGYFQFLLDPTAMTKLSSDMQMPTMTYVNIIGNVGVAIPLDDRGLAVEIGGTYRYVRDVGQAARDLFGADTTGGYAWGGRLGIGGDAAFIARGLFWSVTAEALIFNTAFSGPSSWEDGGIGGFPSGSDRYLRGTAVFGYRYR